MSEVGAEVAMFEVTGALKRIWKQLGRNIHDDGGIVEEIAFREWWLCISINGPSFHLNSH